MLRRTGLTAAASAGAVAALVIAVTGCGGGGERDDGLRNAATATAVTTATADGAIGTAMSSALAAASTPTDSTPTNSTPTDSTPADSTPTDSAAVPRAGARLEVRQQPNGKALYVATTGSDSDDGSRARPFATLQRAAASAVPGTTVWIDGGTYRWAGGTWLPVNGTADNWIVVRPTERTAGRPDRVVILGAGRLDNNGPACIATPGSYLDLRHITCDGFASNGFLLLGVHHVRVLNSTVRNMGGTGIAVYPGFYPPDPTVTPAYQVVIEGNRIRNTNARWKKADFRPPHNLPPWGQGISAFGDQITLRNNRIDATIGEGIGIIGLRIWAVGNTVSNSCSPGLYLDTTSESLVEANLVVHNNPAFFADCPVTVWSGGQPMSGSGIQVAAETDSYTGRPQPHLRNNVIRNNIIVNARQAFFYGSYAYDNGGGDGMKGMRIVNNTFVGGTESLLALGERCADAGNAAACLADPRTAHQDTVFANNIFYWTASTVGKRVSAVDNAVGITLRNNLWFSAGPAAAAGPGDVYADPLFANPAGFAATDFRLKPGSAASNAGSAADAPPFDYFGLALGARPAADIGAVRGP